MNRVYSVGLVGIGAMGSRFAARLLAAGHDIWLLPHHDLSRFELLVNSGAHRCVSAGELAERCEVVIASLPDVLQVQEVLFGEAGLITGASEELLFIDMSTITPNAAQDHHARLRLAGVSALDAPVSGGPMRAADGTLTIMVGGDAHSYERALPILGSLGTHIVHVGTPGSGQAVKLVNQLLISSIMVANAEALTLGVRSGIALETLLDVVGTSSGSNYLLTAWLPRTLFAREMESGFALDLLMKDLRAALSWAQSSGSPVFAGALSEQLYRLAHTDDNGRLDYSIVSRIYEKANGVELKLLPPKD